MADLGNINKLKLPNGDIVHFKDNVSGYTTNTGTITKITTTAGTHATVNVSSGAVSFNVPTKTSHLTNDSGFITDISGKADKATTLSGYGITDAYTKTEIDGKISGVLHYKGNKDTTSTLPSTGNATGDVWHIVADGSEWAWDGEAWQELGKAVDLSGYVPTSRTVNGKALSSNITLNASDVSALPSTHTYSISLATTSDTNEVSLAANTRYKLTAGGKSIVFTTPADSNPVTSVNGQTGAVNLSASDVGALPTGYTYTTEIKSSTGTNQVTLSHGGKYAIIAGGTSYVFTMPAAPSVPTTAANSATGISIANHSTGSIYGVKSGTNSTTTASKASGGNGTAPTLGAPISVTGVKSTTTTASKVSSGGNSTLPSLTFTVDSTDTNQLNISWSAGTASSWQFNDVTVPVKNDSATSIPNVTNAGTASTWEFTDVTVPIRADNATTVVTDGSHNITDNGHTHTLS